MFQLSVLPIDSCALKNLLENPIAGAFVSFEGWVRNHNEGRQVVALDYEAFESLATAEAEKIIAEAKTKFDILDGHCVHRIGKLNIGDIAVWVGVNSAHRKASFDACRYIIDEIKTRLPIWKKECYSNGDSGWVNCQGCVSHNNIHFESAQEQDSIMINENAYYSRQMILREISHEGQKKLKQSKILVVGAGGLGSPALTYLAASGVGTLGICEFDKLETSNLHRQILYNACDIGKNKAELASIRLKELNPFITTIVHHERLSEYNVMSLLQQYDLVLDCTDNFATKFLINDAAVLSGIPLIQASIYQYEGQILFYIPSCDTACLRCLWPEIPDQSCIGSCAEVGVIGAIPGIFGTMQAMEAIKWILDIPSAIRNSMILIDFMSYAIQKIKTYKNPSCPLCGIDPKIKEIHSYNYHQSSSEEDFFSVIPEEDLTPFKIIDIRELFENKPDMQDLLSIQKIPLSQFNLDNPPLDQNHKYLICCQKGIRSKKLVKQLRDIGFNNTYSLKGGLEELNKNIVIQQEKHTLCNSQI